LGGALGPIQGGRGTLGFSREKQEWGIEINPSEGAEKTARLNKTGERKKFQREPKGLLHWIGGRIG